jgi:hypothetical protein
VSSSQNSTLNRDLVYLLLALAAIAGSLFSVFTLLATTQIDEALAVVLFLVAGCLLLAGYMVGLMILGIVILPLVRHVSVRRDQRTVK